MLQYAFPEDLREAQLALHQTRAAYEQYAAGLPWSAEPMPGWDSERQPYTSFRSGKADSPGYTQEQAAKVRAAPSSRRNVTGSAAADRYGDGRAPVPLPRRYRGSAQGPGVFPGYPVWSVVLWIETADGESSKSVLSR
jgi:hypothetical protein